MARACPEIDGIDWSVYQTAYGSAVDVPALLRRICDVSEGERPHAELANLLNHQGTVYSAAGPASRTLVSLAIAGEPYQQENALVLLARLSIGPGLGDLSAGGDPVEAVRRVVESRIDQIVPLMGSSNPRVGVAAIFLVAQFPATVQRHLGALQTLQRHQSPYVRGLAILALAANGFTEATTPEVSWEDEQWRDAFVGAWTAILKARNESLRRPYVVSEAVDEAMCVAMAALYP